MRKLILLIVTVLLIVTLSGCKGLGEDTKPNDKRFVSAIGFDESGGEIAACMGEHGIALLGEFPRAGGADAAGSARDERDFLFHNAP